MYTVNADTNEYVPFGEGEQQAGEVHWITEGVSGIWRVLPGQLPETVPYEFDEPETMYILQGSVRITTEDGHDVSLRPGDVAHFLKGVRSVWHFELPFRKLFVHA